MSATIQRAAPYQEDILDLPVANVDKATPFYETIMGFIVVGRSSDPYPSVLLERDGVRIGLAENGRDPSQHGAFFQVNDIEAVFEEFRANGLERDEPGFRVDDHGDRSFRVFFIVAPDQLCYCIGEDVTGSRD